MTPARKAREIYQRFIGCQMLNWSLAVLLSFTLHLLGNKTEIQRIQDLVQSHIAGRWQVHFCIISR